LGLSALFFCSFAFFALFSCCTVHSFI
jgi:hypothetical protein